jgi:hypothetical protein
MITGSYRSEKAPKWRNTVSLDWQSMTAFPLWLSEPWFPVNTEEVRM